MPDHSDLNPDRLKPGLKSSNRLKPGLVRPGYTSGTPTQPSQIKPSLRDKANNLKPGLVSGNTLKPSLRNGNAPIWTPASIAAPNLLHNLGEVLTYAASPIAGLPVIDSSIGTAAPPRGHRCIQFDGNNDFVTRGARLTPSGAFTICMWVNLPSIVAGRTLVAEYDTTFVFWIGTTPTGIEFYVYGSAGGVYIGNLYTAPGTLEANTPTHLAFVYDGGTTNDSIKLYKNGVFVSRINPANMGSFTGTNPAATAPFQLGSYFNAISVINAKMWDARLYAGEKSQSQIQAIRDQHLNPGVIDTAGAIAIWPLQEESGTTHYDIVGNNDLTANNVDQASYHATDAGVRYSFPNEIGYTLSGNVVIPRSLTTPTQDANSGALQFAGPIKLSATMEVPCVTGDGGTVRFTLGSALLPATADHSGSLLYFHVTNDTTLRNLVTQRRVDAAGILFVIVANITAGAITLGVGPGTPVTADIPNALRTNSWHLIEWSRVGSLWTLRCTPIGGTTQTATCTSTDALDTTQPTRLGYNVDVAPSHNNGRFSDFRITTGGVTTIFPIQAGPGSSNTNRDLHFIRTDGTGGVVSNAIVGGSVAAIWANRTNVAPCYCLLYGGNIGANGAFIPGRIGNANDAAGNPKTLLPGKHRNPFSRLIRNPFNAPSLTLIGATPTSRLAPGDNDQATAPANTKFTSGFDRYFATRVPLTGSELSSAEGYRS